MFKHTRLFPILALMLTTFVASTSFAKVPYRAGEERASQIAASADTASRTASIGRFGRISKVANAEPRKECAHSHRYSWQHLM